MRKSRPPPSFSRPQPSPGFMGPPQQTPTQIVHPQYACGPYEHYVVQPHPPATIPTFHQYPTPNHSSTFEYGTAPPSTPGSGYYAAPQSLQSAFPMQLSLDHGYVTPDAPLEAKEKRRAHKACDRCRERKARCDEAKPNCSNCKDPSECTYRENNSTKSETMSASVLAKVEGFIAEQPKLRKEVLDRLVDLKHHVTRNSHDAQMPEGRQIVDKHVTAAHKLLYLWPSIYKLTCGAQSDPRRDYVLYGEARPWLKVDGNGEDLQGNRCSLPDQASQADRNLPHASQLWMSAPYQHTNGRSSSHQHRTDLVDLDPDRIEQLLEVYRCHFHAMHPIVNLDRLNAYKDKFLHKNPTAATASMPMSTSTSLKSRPAKRAKTDQTSSSIRKDHADVSNLPSSTRSTCERTPHAAIFFLAIALGAMAEHQGPIPGPSNGKRNMDIIPGLVYYNEGVQMLGIFSDSNDLSVAQAMVLAGLYKGQMARSLESWSWIYSAASIVRRHALLQNMGRQEDDAHQTTTHWKLAKQQLLLTYWTVLQLESDILAELDYPASGLAVMHMPTPPSKNNPACPDDRVMEYYYMQLHLRKFLNEMHMAIYGSTKSNDANVFKDPHDLAIVLDHNETLLVKWRFLNKSRSCKWEEGDLPAEDILDARLRGKFYGALYISLRTFLDYALHAMVEVRERRAQAQDCALDAYGKARPNYQARFFEAVALMNETDVIARARRCVQAAIRSTIAFDNVPGRQVVTNIAGTCHAQFSNMLVLCACATSGLDFLTELIPLDLLGRLIRRTIHFLAQLGSNPTASNDIDILQHLHVRLGIMYGNVAFAPVSATTLRDDMQDYRNFDRGLVADTSKFLRNATVEEYQPIVMSSDVPNSLTDGNTGSRQR